MSFSRYLSKLGQLLNSSGQVLPSGLATGTDFTIAGLTVGKGGGSVSTNTVVGASALAAATSGDYATAIGYEAALSTTTATRVTAIGAQALRANTTGRNTALGWAALYSNTTGTTNTALGDGVLYTNTGDANTGAGYGALLLNSSGANNTAVGVSALRSNTTANSNTAVGYQAGYANTTGNESVFIGYQAGLATTTGVRNTVIGSRALLSATTAEANTVIGMNAGSSLTTGSNNTFVGGRSNSGGNEGAGHDATTGSYNNFFGSNAGGAVTTGSKNTILGNYNGNNGIDIRTASNNIALSDGDGNLRAFIDASGWFSAGDTPAYLNLSVFRFNKQVTQGTQLMTVSAYPTSNEDSIRIYAVTTAGMSTAGSAIQVAKNGGTNRSINAAGTINASGADYAEYMTKASDFVLAKGDVVGVDANGKLTNVFADAISFVVKSTDPSYVGGDTWFNEPMPRNENLSDKKPGDPEYDDWQARMEEARQLVDRIAFCGQVPVNVIGATAGQYIVPVNDNGAIKGVAKNEADLTMSEYIKAVGKVIAIEQDGRAKIIVKVA